MVNLPWQTERWPATEADKPYDPFHYEFHMTRYYHDHTRMVYKHNHEYSQITPWMRHFDFAVGPVVGGHGTTVFTYHPSDDKAFHSGLIKIHISADFRHHKFFMQNMLPFFEDRYRQTGEMILLSSGSGDPSVSDPTMKFMLEFKCVYRWLLENFVTYEMDVNNMDPRIVPIPLGIAQHPNTGQLGIELRRLIEIRKQTESQWSTRNDRILFCFRGDYGYRPEWNYWATHNCTICDVCNYNNSDPDSPFKHGIHETELWNMYLQYKFVFSPLGIGFDCGRNFEVAMLGAIPVIPYMPFVLGYTRTGNLSVITVNSPDDINETALDSWKRDYTSPNELYMFSRDYWDARLFPDEATTTTTAQQVRQLRDEVRPSLPKWDSSVAVGVNELRWASVSPSRGSYPIALVALAALCLLVALLRRQRTQETVKLAACLS